MPYARVGGGVWEFEWCATCRGTTKVGGRDCADCYGHGFIQGQMASCSLCPAPNLMPPDPKCSVCRGTGVNQSAAPGLFFAQVPDFDAIIMQRRM